MICNKIDNDYYIVKVFNNDFDIYDHEEIKNFVQFLFKKLLNKYKIQGNFLLNIYIDNMYGMIIEIKQDKDDFIFDNLLDIKIKFNLNISFLYEIDYFYSIENSLNNQNIYYYNDKYYLEIINDINEKDYLKLLDNSLIIYNDKINEIIENGIKL